VGKKGESRLKEEDCGIATSLLSSPVCMSYLIDSLFESLLDRAIPTWVYSALHPSSS